MKSAFILRLEADGITATVIPAGVRLPVLPPVVAINTMGIPAEDMLHDGRFFAPRPGLYRFSSVACAQTTALGLILQEYSRNRQHVSMTFAEPPEDAPRIFCQLPPTTLLMKAGDSVSRDVYNRGAEDAELWPHAESNAFEIEFLGEPRS